jgi:hypothetical protein
MIKPTTQLLEEAKDDLAEIIDYVASETADVSLLLWLQDLELKLGAIYRRLSSPVKQQSDFETVKSYVEEGKLPPLGSMTTGIQYINKKGN